MDKVFIAGLEVLCTIGAYDWEKSLKQKLIFDLEMDYDNRPAGETDDLARALDYSCVASRVTALVPTKASLPLASFSSPTLAATFTAKVSPVKPSI